MKESHYENSVVTVDAVGTLSLSQACQPMSLGRLNNEPTRNPRVDHLFTISYSVRLMIKTSHC